MECSHIEHLEMLIVGVVECALFVVVVVERKASVVVVECTLFVSVEVVGRTPFAMVVVVGCKVPVVFVAPKRRSGSSVAVFNYRRFSNLNFKMFSPDDNSFSVFQPLPGPKQKI